MIRSDLFFGPLVGGHLTIPKKATSRLARYVIYCDMNFGSSSSHVPTVTDPTFEAETPGVHQMAVF